MDDKTPLERDIEHYELFRIPLSMKILLIILIIALFVTGFYALGLKKELMTNQKEMTEMKDALNNEIIELSGEIKRLRKEVDSSKSK